MGKCGVILQFRAATFVFPYALLKRLHETQRSQNRHSAQSAFGLVAIGNAESMQNQAAAVRIFRRDDGANGVPRLVE
jgi:hypothetical protein